MKYLGHFLFTLLIILIAISIVNYKNSSPVGAPPTPNLPERKLAGQAEPQLKLFAVKIRHPKYKDRVVVFKIIGETKEEAAREAMYIYGSDGIFVSATEKFKEEIR